MRDTGPPRSQGPARSDRASAPRKRRGHPATNAANRSRPKHLAKPSQPLYRNLHDTAAARLPLGFQAVRRSSAVDSLAGRADSYGRQALKPVGIDLNTSTALWPPKPKMLLSATRWKGAAAGPALEPQLTTRGQLLAVRGTSAVHG